MQSRRGAQVIVIHPGSRFLRIGKASEVSPVTILNVVARKCKPPVPEHVERISRPRKDRSITSEPEAEKTEDEYAIQVTSDDPVGFGPLSYHLSFERFHNLTVRCKSCSHYGFATRQDAVLQTSCHT